LQKSTPWEQKQNVTKLREKGMDVNRLPTKVLHSTATSEGKGIEIGNQKHGQAI